MQLHRLPKRPIALCLGAGVGLHQRVDWVLHQPDAHPPVPDVPHDRAMMCAIDGECLAPHPAGGFVRHGDRCHGHGPIGGAIAIEVAIALLHDGLEILVDRIDAARRVHPTGAIVETLIDEDLAPGDGPVSIEPLLAHDLQLSTEEERRMRIDQQQCVMVYRVHRRDGESIGAARIIVLGRRHRTRAAVVECLQLA